MRLALVALVAALSFPALAQPAPDGPDAWDQTATGVRLLGGAATFTRFDSNTSASLSPRAGRFVADGLAVSAALQLAYSRSELATAGTFSSTRVGVGPTVTYYVGGGATARPFVEADLLLSYARQTSDVDEALGRSPSWDASVGGGLAAGVELPIARNVALRGQAFYRAQDFSFDDELTYYGLSAGFTTFIY